MTNRPTYRYVSVFTDNRGKLRARFRRKGFSAYMKALPGDDGFDDEYGILCGQDRPTPSKKPKEDSFDAACAAYYASLEFTSLKDSSKRAVRTAVEPLREKYGELPIKRLERRNIKNMMAKQSGPGAANKLLRYFRQILNVAVDHEMITQNPAIGIKQQKVPGDGFKPWEEEQIALYEAHWAIGTKQRLAFDLLLFTGQRRSDMVNMTPANVRNGEIRVVQQKTETTLWIPIHPALKASIDATPRAGLQYITTSFDRPFTAEGFGNWFRKHCKAAGVPAGYSAHGLRKAAGRRLAESGATAHQIMSILGHKSLKEAEKYCRDADQKTNARKAVAHLVRSSMSSNSNVLSSNKVND